VPEGRNHYYDLRNRAIADRTGEWGHYTWFSADILPEAEILSAKRDLDPLTFRQEYEASFVNFEGQAYYPFDAEVHCARLRQNYNPRGSLVFCMDFNVEPGTATILQEMELPRTIARVSDPVVVDDVLLFKPRAPAATHGTGIIGEVHIPRNSNTVSVCNKLIQDWGEHQGHVYVYGDATGGARGTAQTEGSDWDLVRRELYNHFGSERVHLRIPKANPSERSRVNAVNTRLAAGDGAVRLMVDGEHCPETVKDFEGVRLLAGGSGEIDKKHDPKLTHLTDGVGYYVSKEFPVRGKRTVSVHEELL
jgi:hypothetical protein